MGLTVLVLVTGVMYLLVLMPFAAVLGDMSYIPTKTFWDAFRVPPWRKECLWQQAARRKATDLNLGMLHPNPDHNFVALIFELLTKSGTAIWVTMTTNSPLPQMGFLSVVHTLMFAQSLLFPPVV